MTQQPPLWSTGRQAVLATLLLFWFAAATAIGLGEVLPNLGASPVPPIALTVAVPVLVFLGAYRLVPGFRRFVLAQDIETLTTLQLWRVMGFGFLMLYANGVLPGLFAWPAGLGDVAVGVAAAVVVLHLRRAPEDAHSRRLVRFHLLGLADFALAVTTAGLASGFVPALTADGVTSAPMDVWPLNLFPGFFVPLFIILHLAVLLKVAQHRAAPLPALTAAE